jgi:endonuclease/exonuclease/phosphatase family metal-dependent hydrolase
LCFRGDSFNPELYDLVKIRCWPRQRWFRLALIVSVVLLLPYLFSRFASPWRRVSVYSMPTGAAATPQRSDASLRIACYNIAHGRGLAASNWQGGSRAERLARLDQIAQLLRRMDADVVVLNEVDFQSSWSHSVNQARVLAEKAGYAYRAEQRNVDCRVLLSAWRFGNAVLSKYPIVDARVIDLPGYSAWETVLAGEKRGVLCDIKAGEQAVRIVGLHLSYRSEAVRAESAVLAVQIAADSSVPVIIAGDLNSTPPDFPGAATTPDGDNAIAVIDRSGRFCRSPASPPVTDSHFTFHSAEPRQVIDWIIIPADWHFRQYRVQPSPLSDHRPVFADVVPHSAVR